MKISKKKLLIITFLIVVLLVLTTACQKEPDEATTSDENLELFTLEELSNYNGKDGNPAYIAVDGIVYDVTDSRPWKNGQHNGFEAGLDLTEAIKNQSPHGVSKLSKVKKIGKLVE